MKTHNPPNFFQLYLPPTLALTLQLIFMSCCCFADFTIEQVTLVKASSAEIVQKEDHVLIVAKDLQTTPIYGIRFVAQAKYIQVYNIVTINGQSFASFPPRIYESTDNKYLITGKPGDKLGIAVPVPDGPPTYQEATIQPSTPPEDDPPPVGDFAELTKLSDKLADEANDPLTRAKLVSAYTAVLLPDKTYQQLVDDLKFTRQTVLGTRPKPIKSDWEPWRKGIEAELLKVVKPGDTSTYIAAFKAIIEGLRQ